MIGATKQYYTASGNKTCRSVAKKYVKVDRCIGLYAVDQTPSN